VGLEGQSSNDSGQSKDIGEGNSGLLKSEEQRRPGEVESEGDPVEVQGVDGGGSSGGVNRAVESRSVKVLSNEVRSETRGGVEDTVGRREGKKERRGRSIFASR